jgi:hypothetical protein
MSNSSFSGPSAHASTLRRMNILVALLVVSNIATGIFSVYLLRKVDARYSDLIAHTVPVLNDLQTLTANSALVMRGTNPAKFAESAGQVELAVQRGRTAIETDRALRARLLQADWLPETTDKRKEFQSAGDAFSGQAEGILKLFAAGQGAQAAQLREGSLFPVFERYQQATTKVADLLQDESMATNSELTAKTSSLSAVVLGVAGWPIIVMTVLLLLTVCFVLVLMFIFRGKELGDAP